MYGGASKDIMNYTVTGGSDKVTINAGQGDDTLTINKNQKELHSRSTTPATSSSSQEMEGAP